MTHVPNDHGDILRRVLRAEADAVVPSPEGLEIIRARIERRGLRGLFWWRAGAAAAGAVLVAGTIVMVVPDLRQRVLNVPIDEAGTTTTISPPPDMSATARPKSKLPTPPASEPGVAPIPIIPPSSTSRAPATTQSTTKPKPSPAPTTCPPVDGAIAPEPPTAECPDGVPTPTPTLTPTADATEAPELCPTDECPPEDPAPPQEIATPASTG